MTQPLAIVQDMDYGPQVAVGVQAAYGTHGVPYPIEARYRIWVKTVDRAPETDAATAVSGDTIVERIDGFGDFDRFEIPLAAAQEFRVFFARDSLSAAPVSARLRVINGPTVNFTMGAGDSVLDLRRSEWIQKLDNAPAIVEVFGDPNAPVDEEPLGYRILYQQRLRAPETAPATIGLVDSVVTETLSSCADADDFVLTGRPNTYVYVHLGAVLDGAPGCRVRVRLMLGDIAYGDGALGEIDSVRIGTDTDVNRSPPVFVPATGVVRLRIEGLDAPDQPIGRVQNVGYTLDIYAPDSTPEIAPVELELGDSLVTETIDRCSDVDAFDIVGPPGSVVVVNFGLGRATTCGLALSAESTGSGVFHYGANEDAARTGHFWIPASGRLPLRVSTERGGTHADRGAPYFLKATAVNTDPELGSAILALGDTVHETISRCGDIDTWHVPLVEGEPVLLRLDRARTSSCSIEFSVRYGGFPPTILPLEAPLPLAPIVRFFSAHTTGTFEVTVYTYPSGHTDDRDLPYSLVVTGAQNEVAPSMLAVGDTSAIEPYHETDLDLFIVPLQAGTEYVAATLGPVTFTTTETPGSGFQYSFEEYARGYRLPVVPTITGDHRFRMGAGGNPLGPSANFRFMVHELHLPPESINDTLSVGDTTAVELFDHPGDEDVFVAALTAGRYFRLRSFPSAGSTGGILVALNVAGGETEATFTGNEWSTRRFSVPTNGRVTARLKSFLAAADTMTNPSYRLRLVEIDPAPESRAATLAPADSITDEPLDDAYDLDEYQFTVTTAGTYAVRFEAASTCGAGDDHLRLVVRNSAIDVATMLNRTDAATAGTVALASGTAYTLAVDAVDPVVGDCVMRTYRAKLTLQP